jgi:hypothetical protein
MDRMKTELRQKARLIVVLFLTITAMAASAQAQLVITSPSNYGTQSVGSIDAFGLSATGGAPPYTWTLVSGTLPDGVSIRTDLPGFLVGGASSAALIGVATTPGTFNFRVRVTDSALTTKEQDCTIKISTLMIKDFWTLPDGFQTLAYTHTLTALRDGAAVPATWDVVNGGYNAIVTITNASPAVVSWTGHGLSNNAVVRFSSQGPATLPAGLFFNTAYYVKNATANTFEVSATPGGASVTTTSSGSGTFVGTALPPGMSLDPITGELFGTPTRPGFYGMSLNVTQGGDTVSRGASFSVFALHVTAPGPAFGTLPNGMQNVFYSQSFTTTGGTPSYTYSATGLPSGLSFGTPNCAPGQICGTPTSKGVFTLTVTVTDSALVSYSKRWSLDILDAAGLPHSLPAIAPYSNALGDCTIGYPCSQGVSVFSGGTAPFTWSAIGLPPGMSIRNGNDAVATPNYIAADAEIWGTASALGTYMVTVTVTDSDVPSKSATNTFPMKVSELLLNNSSFATWTRDLPPVAPAQNYQVLRVIGGPSLPAFGDPAPDGATLYTAALLPAVNSSQTGLPPTGVAFSAAPPLFSGTPTENISSTTRLRFTHTASGQQLDTNYFFSVGGGTSTIQINTNSNLGTITAGLSYSNQLSACCANSITWSMAPGSPAFPGFLSLTAGGVLTIASSTSVAGTYTFFLRAADTSNPANYGQRWFTLTVSPLNITGNSTLLPGDVDTFYSQPLPLTGAAAGATVWSLMPFSYLPPGLNLSSPGPFPPVGSGNGLLSGTPSVSGQYSFTVKAVDFAGNVFIRTFNLTIYPHLAYPPVTCTSLGPNLGPFSLGTLTLGLTCGAGGTGTGYTYSLKPGAPTVPGMRIQQGAPLPTGFSSTTTAGFLGVLTTPGTFPTTIRVTDSLGNSADRDINVTVVGLQILSQTTLPKATLNVPYAFTLTPFGNVGSLSWSATGLPSGLSLSTPNCAFGQICGTLTTGTGTATFFPQITLTDSAGPSSVTVTFTLTANGFDITAVGVAPAGSGVLPLGTVGVPYSQTFVDNGCSGTCTWSVTNQPGTLTINPSTGVLSGTPTGTANQSITITRTGTGFNSIVSRLFSLQVVPASPQVLSITSPTNTYPAAGSFFSLGAVTATGLFASGGLPPYSWTLDAGSLPTGVTLQGPGESLGVLNPGFTYLAGRFMQAGTYTFTLRATDTALNFVTRTFTWTVAALNNQYTSLPLSGSTLIAGNAYTQKLLALGGAAVEGTGSYTWTNLSPWPLGLTLDSNTGVLSGTTFETGSVSVPVQITDAGPSHPKLVSTVTVNVTGSTTLSFTTGSSLTTGFPGNVFNTAIVVTGGTPFPLPGPLYNITVEAPTSLPPGFALLTGDALPTNFAAGSIVFSGAPSVPGLYTFTLRATDAVGNFRLRTFTFPVAPFAPATSTALPDGGVGESYSERLLAWDSTSSVTWSVTNGSSLPPGLSLSSGVLTTNGGTLTQAGTFSFSLDATDVSGLVASLTFNMKVTGFRITSPQELPQPAIVGVPFSYQFTASTVASWQSNSGVPSGLNLTSGGLLSGTLSSATVGPFILNIQATVGATFETRRFTLYTRFPNRSVLDVPVGNTLLADATVGVSAAYLLTPNGGMPPYSWSVAAGSSLPPGINFVTAATYGSPTPTNTVLGFTSSAFLNPGGTVLAGTPTSAADYTFDLVLTDALGAQSRRTFTLHVSPMTILQTTLATGRVGTAYSRQFTVAGGTGPYTFTMRPVGASQDMVPPPLTLSPAGLLSGTPTSTGNYAFFLEAKDALNRTFARRYTLFVTNASGLFVTNFNQADSPIGVGRRSLTLGLSVLNANGSQSFPPGTYTWSLVSGSLPPGVSLLTGDLYANADQTILGGQPMAPGLFVFTLRATQVGTPSNSADHTFTYRVAPMQSVAPATEAFVPPDLPAAQVGVFYSTTLKMAGGTPPYSFVESPFAPLPAWLTLSSSGVLSGTPPAQAIGVYTVSPIVTDSALPTGQTLNFGSLLVVTDVTGAPALLPIPSNQGLAPASVDVPYNFPLDLVLRGGTGPFTWSVSAGSTLPPGLVILTGANGVSSYIGGVPTTVSIPDEFEFSLDVQDSGSPSPQSLTVKFSLGVSSLAVTPDTVMPGIVGVPYSAVLTPSGGTAPYTIFVYPLEADSPPGLTVHPSGGAFVLDGIPTSPGNFPFLLAVQDSTGNITGRFYRFAVDNPTIAQPLGEAPAVFLTPTPIDVSYRMGDLAPAAIPIAVNATSGTFPFGLSIAGIPGATLSVGSGSAPGASSLNWNMAGIGVGTYYGILGARAQAVNLVDQIPVVLRVSAPCGYSLNPASGNSPAAGGTGAFNVSTGGDCAWTATPDSPWITINGASSGTGSAAINFSIAPNNGIDPLDPLDDPTFPRVGSINVQGHIYSITQFGSDCSFGISPGTLSAPASGGSAVVTVTASHSGCEWTASGLDATWTNAPAPGNGSGSVTVTIPPNPLPESIVRTATIAGQTFTVYQGGVACIVDLSALASSPQPAGGGPGSVFVTRVDGCAYDTVVGPSWVSVTSGGSHDDSLGQPLMTTLVYEVQPNSTTIARSGTLTIGGKSYTISQDGLACSVTVDTSSLGSPYGPSAGFVGTIGVTANGPNCSWVADSGAGWASISPHSGGGLAGTIYVNVQSNAGSITPRTADLSIAGQIVSIAQAGTTCTYGLQSSTGSLPTPGGLGTVGVIAPSVCNWTAVSNDPAWLTILSSGSAGNANVLFSALPNGLASPRIGTLSIRDAADAVVRTYTVTQAPLTCTYTLGSPGVTLAAQGTIGTASFGFSAAASCTPTAVSYADWVTVVNPVGAGSVEYSVAPNPTTSPRTGTIQLGNKTFTINEQGGSCGFSINAYGAAFSQPGGPGSVLGTSSGVACPLVVGTDQPSFISLVVPPTEDPVTHIFTLPYSVLPYLSLNVNVRFGKIVFGGQTLTVKQTSW